MSGFLADTFNIELQLYFAGCLSQFEVNAKVLQQKTACATESLSITSPGILPGAYFLYRDGDGPGHTTQGEITCQFAAAIRTFFVTGAGETCFGKFCGMQEILVAQMLVPFGMIGCAYCSLLYSYLVLLARSIGASSIEELPDFIQPAGNIPAVCALIGLVEQPLVTPGLNDPIRVL